MTFGRRDARRARRSAAVVAAALLGLWVAAPAMAGDTVPASLSDVRASDAAVNATLVLRSPKSVSVDPKSVQVTVGGKPATVKVAPAAQQSRSTMLVIDTSGSMNASGMATVRSAVSDFLAALPKDVKVGVVSFASTSGVDVPPTTDRARVSREVAALVSKGETALYAGLQDAVKALGTKGERSVVLLSDGGDTVEELQGGAPRAESQRKAAVRALQKNKVRAEVVAFNSAEGNTAVLEQFARAGGGSVANASDRAAVARAFTAAARALESQAVLEIKRPAGVSGTQEVVVSGTGGGQPFEVRTAVDLGDTAPLVSSPDTETIAAGPLPMESTPFSALSPVLLYTAIAVLTGGLFLLTVAFMGPVFRSRRSERIHEIEAYGFAKARPTKAQSATPTALSAQLISMGDRVMEGRESTTKTMQLLDRADLPWRAGEWLVIRLIAIVVAAVLGFVLFGSLPLAGLAIGALVGFFGAPLVLKYLANRRTKKFESVLPDVLMLVATSLSSGFSLLQALDAVGKDAAEPAAKEFSRALAEARIGADVSDALEHMAVRMDSENMRWAVMAIRIQRDVGGNLAETLRTTAATLREREMLKRQVRALSAEGRLSAYVLIALPFGLFFYMLWVNYDYVSLLWTNLLGIIMLVGGAFSLIIGIFWMRNVVKIEV
jgi:tight adherence protein B